MEQSYGFFVQWHLTDRCNLACRHCYQKGVSHSELSADRIALFIRETREMLDDWATEYELKIARSFQFTGGEPMLRKDLARILTTACDEGFQTFLMTNGTLIDKTTAEEIKHTGVSAVQISLEGMPKTHDSIRGAGNFIRAAAGISALAQAGVDVTANVTLTKANVGEVLAITKKAANLGASRIGFARLVPEGRGASLGGEMLSSLEVKDVYQKIKNIRVSGIKAMTRDPISCLVSPDGIGTSCGGVAVGGCAAGLSGVSIMPDGAVMPCRRMNMVIGSIVETPLREIWAVSPVLNMLRDKSKYTGECGKCEKWDVCRGCRAVSLAVTKANGAPDMLADDPQCFKNE
jgi:AdoMet-dependent heme synthase